MTTTQTVRACHSRACLEPATERVYWPGTEPAPVMCESCARRARGVAAAMGFPIITEVLEDLEDDTP